MRRVIRCASGLLLLALAGPAAAAPARLVYSTFLGGSDNDSAFAVATDARGNTYVTGTTPSADFPVSGFLLPPRGSDAFVTKLDPDGRLVWSVWLGGSSHEIGFGIGVGPGGDVYVTGVTYSVDFPRIATSLPAPPAGLQGFGDVFIARIDASGSFLHWSTTLGGSATDEPRGMAVDRAGAVYVTGATQSPDFPTRAALQPASLDAADAFLVKLTRGGALVYSTYLGGSSYDSGWDVDVDAAGNTYVLGDTSSDDLPAANAAQPSPGGGGDAFVARLAPSGASLVWLTYLGGSSQEIGRSMALDHAGNAYVTGFTESPDFPTRRALKSTLNLLWDFYPSDAFVTKLGRSGAFVYSTYLGGSHADMGEAIAVDAQGGVYVAGMTQSTDFPVRDAFQAECGPDYGEFYCPPDVFIARLAPSGDALDWASYLGGSAGSFPMDWPMDLALDPRGNVSLAGWTYSTDFPTVNAVQPSWGGGDIDAFVVKIAPPKRPSASRTTSGGGGAATAGRWWIRHAERRLQ